MSTCAYNRAVQYLMDKCGKIGDTTYVTPKEGFTTEYRIHLLLGQYYYGIAAQKELENLMNNLEMSN